MTLEFCSLASGSSGNCQYIGSDKTKLILDAGLSGKYVTNGLLSINVDPASVNGILVTHEHTDHVKGVGILMRKYGWELYVNESTWNAMESKMGKVDHEKIHFIEKGKEFTIGDIKILPFEISHDAIDPVGYSFMKGQGNISVLTDLGIVTDEIIDVVKHSDLLVMESNHDIEMLKIGPYPAYLKKRILSERGHLSNVDAGKLIGKIMEYGKVKNVLLAHLSKENNFPDLAYETVRQELETRDILLGKDINVELTYRDRVSKIYRINP